MILRLIARAKSLEESTVIPDWDSVVRSVHPMNESLDRITAIIQQKSDKSDISQSPQASIKTGIVILTQWH